jgi:hypothetical protein
VSSASSWAANFASHGQYSMYVLANFRHYVIIEMDSSLTGDVANHRSMGMDAVRAVEETKRKGGWLAALTCSGGEPTRRAEVVGLPSVSRPLLARTCDTHRRSFRPGSIAQQPARASLRSIHPSISCISCADRSHQLNERQRRRRRCTHDPRRAMIRCMPPSAAGLCNLPPDRHRE